MDLKELDFRLNSLVIFRDILNNKVVQSLSLLLSSDNEDMLTKIKRYSSFVYELYKKTGNLTDFILELLLENENSYIINCAEKNDIDSLIEECTWNELESIEKIAKITPEDITGVISYNGYLPKWRTSDIDFKSVYQNRIKNINYCGYGIYSKYNAFIIKKDKITPVKCPDNIEISELIGYNRERDAVENNTLSLLEGKPAQNVLLYGDAGTGKSSTVKALVNKYSPKGLRLIEVTKEQLRNIPYIIDSISHNPLKFILFIDDLSFDSGENCFGELKAMLEGSVSARADNIVIYATSNRRHLVKESFSDRNGDDVHRNDTIQELISLSSRFGLKVNFSRPDKKSYLEIVTALAIRNNIDMDAEILSVKAESFAIRNGGRSARTAKQFVNQLISDTSNQ